MFNEIHTCENCQNESLCKWCDEMDRVQTENSKININHDSPIKTQTTCEKFIRKNKKQDGFRG